MLVCWLLVILFSRLRRYYISPGVIWEVGGGGGGGCIGCGVCCGGVYCVYVCVRSRFDLKRFTCEEA